MSKSLNSKRNSLIILTVLYSDKLLSSLKCHFHFNIAFITILQSAWVKDWPNQTPRVTVPMTFLTCGSFIYKIFGSGMELYSGPVSCNWAHYAVMSAFSANNLHPCRPCYHSLPTAYCNNSCNSASKAVPNVVALIVQILILHYATNK